MVGDKHTVLKSLIVVPSSIFLMVVAYALGQWMGVTPHVVLTYMIGAVISAWGLSAVYDKVVLRKVDKQLYQVLAKQQRRINQLERAVRRLERINGIQKSVSIQKRDKK